MSFDRKIDFSPTLIPSATGPGFCKGTRISTCFGDTAVESLKIGTLVKTYKNGYQPLRDIKLHSAIDFGRDAAVHISAGTFGSHGALSLSPEIRILRRGPLAELVFGEKEVLFCTKHLVNGTNCTILRSQVPLTYVSILFDQTQIIYAENHPVECIGPQDLKPQVRHRSQMRRGPALRFLHELGF